MVKPKTSFGLRLRCLRMGKLMTQKELAKKIGWADSRIGMYERGDCRPKRKAVEKIAAGLDVTVEELLEGVGYL